MIAGGEAGHTPGQDGSTLGTGGGPCQAGDVTAPRSVLVVDDQAPFRSAARAVLRRLEGFEFAGEASSGPEAIELVERLRPSLVLMDINMPEMNGIEATRRIVSAHPEVTVILCSTHDPNDLPADASASGAIAYVSKEHLAADTLRRLWDTRDSGTFVSC
jgi:two-component system, NarL family, invasion response regulator UvrY